MVNFDRLYQIIIAVFVIIILVIILRSFYNRNTHIEAYENYVENTDPYEGKRNFVKMLQIAYNDKDGQKELTDEIKRLTKINYKSRILDAGCGVGNIGRFFKNYSNYYGIDISKEKLKRAYINNPSKNYKENDLIIPDTYSPVYFDLVLLLGKGLYENSTPKRRKILENIYTWLKPDGYMCLTLYDGIKNDDDLNFQPQSYSIYNGTGIEPSVITHHNHFSHFVKWSKNEKDNVLIYTDEFEFPDNPNIKSHDTKLHINDQIMTDCLKLGFELKEIIDEVNHTENRIRHNYNKVGVFIKPASTSESE